jgi:Na+-transporting methylmalonyl-CoA/oxaloacetate decarboxylase gamma subunit
MTDQVGGVVASAGKALEALGGSSGEAGWELDLDAPQSTVGTEQQGPRQAVGVLLAVAAVAVAIVMLFVLKDLLDGKYHHRQAVTIALAGGVVLVVLSLVVAAWRALANSDARVRLKLRRVAPAPGVDPALLLGDLVAQIAGASPAAAARAPSGAPTAKNVDADPQRVLSVLAAPVR